MAQFSTTHISRRQKKSATNYENNYFFECPFFYVDDNHFTSTSKFWCTLGY